MLSIDKYCNKCDTYKPRTDFYPRSGIKGQKGYVMSICKECHKQKVVLLDYRGRHPRRAVLYARKHQVENPDKVCALVAKQKADKINRTPLWADIKAIEAIYTTARALSQSTGIPHEVDHIIPLKGDSVSGLHVPENLRAIPAKENWKKHNFFDMEVN